MVADALVFEPVTAEVLRADRARALRLAELSLSAQPEFYRLIPLSRDAILDGVARQIAEPAFDMARAFVLSDGSDAALITDTDMAMLASAQMAALMAFLRLVPASAKREFQERMRAYSASIEPIDDAGRYVSRVAVASGRQGQGLGRRAMSDYLGRVGAVKVHLHVHRDNAAAIALYRSQGFVPRSDADYVFPALTRARG
ncbi:MAG TPA: GNAT family N-acetyltransferase [Rhizomicrobium sp.]|nr:GNAT family N-acetyltransferase [Rhizomicrobium sp.]